MIDLDRGFTLATLHVEPRRSCVTSDAGTVSRLEPRAMAVLVHLAAADGAVVRRDELLDAVWQTTVGDEVLSRAISLIRQALGDDSRAPRFVETVPKIGYRLLVPARPAAADPGPETPEAAPPKADPAASESAPQAAGRREEAPAGPAQTATPGQVTPGAPAAGDAAGSDAPADSAADSPAHSSAHSPADQYNGNATSAQPGPARGSGHQSAAHGRPRSRGLMGLGIAALALLVLLAGALLTTRDEGASTASTAETAQTGKTSETPFGPPSDAPRALAILPLQDLAMEGTARPLGLGLADALRTELGRNPSLRVLARSSSMAVAREAQDARSVGAHFGIDAVLEGSVVQHPERVTVNLSLSDARDGWQRWSESFEGSPDALFEMNRRIVQRVSLALDPTPAPRDGAPEAPEGHAYTLYLQGLHHLGLRGEDGLQRADALLREALALDPEFGAARVALARTLVLTPYWTELGEHEAFPPALELLDERSYGDPLLRGTVAGIRGFVHFRRWEWSAARREFATALQLVPQDAGIRAWYAQYLAAVGELEASLAEARESWALDPGSPIVGSRVAIAELWLGRPGAAARYYDTTDAPDLARRDPSYLIYLLAVEEDETVAGLLRALHAAEGLDTDWVPACIGLIRGSGDREALLARYSAAVENGEVLPRLQFAIWILAGEYERATAFVETHLDQRRLIDVEFAFAAQAEGYRADPSFERMLRLIGHPALAQ